MTSNPTEFCGNSWLRFENHKWDMTSPEPGTYRFDGTVGPWHVPHDDYYAEFVEQGFRILPYLFHTPAHYTTATPDAPRAAQHPPRDLNLYADFAFQSAARYGSQTHPPEALKTNDKISGLDYIQVYSLWNEPNLDDPNWGHWVAPFEEYLEMFRIGAEAVKAADPNAQVATAGFAGIELDILNPLATYTYADGKRPIDFIDVLNVHQYTGRERPETARVNINVQRGGDVIQGPTLEERLLMLDHWRQTHLPGREIWQTETGYDTQGPIGVSYRQQAAYIPRNLMIVLGTGTERVHLFRVSGDRNERYAACGILDNQFNPKPSYYSMATMIREIDAFDRAVRLPLPDERLWVYAFERDGDIMLAAWGIDGPHAWGLDLGRATVTDSFGHRRQKTVTADMTVDFFPVYIRDYENRTEVEALFKAGKAKRAAFMARRDRMAEAPATGFDFGLGAHIGQFDLGLPRPLIPVGPQAVFSAEQGYGFIGQTDQIQANDRHWISDAAQRDSCRVPRGTRFQFEVPDGAYVLDISAGRNTQIKVDTGADPHTIEFESEDDYQRNPITVMNGSVTLQFEGHNNEIRWLRAVPEEFSDEVF